MKLRLKFLIASFSLVLINACSGGSGIVTDSEDVLSASLTQNAFSLGSDFPTDIKVINDTAFIVTAAGVIPIDLNTNPFVVSEQFTPLDLQSLDPSLGAFAQRIILLDNSDEDLNEAILLMDQGLVYFNPINGQIHQSLAFNSSMTPSSAIAASGECDFNGDSIIDTNFGPDFTPSGATDLIMVDDRLFVSIANFCINGTEIEFSQGLVLVFDVNRDSRSITSANPSFILLNGFNATGLTQRQNLDQIIATTSGVLSFTDGVRTESFLTKIDTDDIQTEGEVNLGLAYLNFRSMACINDSITCFVCSAAFSECYKINVNGDGNNDFIVINGVGNPITIVNEIPERDFDFITDQKIAPGEAVLFISSNQRNEVLALDLEDADHEIINRFDVSFSENPEFTGIGALNFHIQDEEEDLVRLLGLTQSPGSVFSINL